MNAYLFYYNLNSKSLGKYKRLAKSHVILEMCFFRVYKINFYFENDLNKAVLHALE